MTKQHVHCWHARSSTTNGMGVNGWDNERCCHCGADRKHHWVKERDPEHGPHADEWRQRYTRVEA